MTTRKQRIMGVVGRSGSGKTTLLCDLIPALIKLGLTVSTIKHTHHNFDIDKPGKDSYRHRGAGAKEVLLTSAQRWALLHEVRDDQEPDMNNLIKRMAPVDVVLVEGFKSHAFPKIEVYRPSMGEPLVGQGDHSIVAVATDEPDNRTVTALNVPVLDLDNIQGIAEFIVTHPKL